jgi:WD40 repeat protein
LAFSPDGASPASGSFDRSIKLWDVRSGRVDRTLAGHPSGQVKGMSFSPGGDVIASAGADRVRLWDVRSGESLKALPSDRGVLAVAFSRHGSTLAAAGGLGIRLWDAHRGQLVRDLPGTADGLWTSLAFSPDGRYLAGGGSDRAARLWDVRTGELVRTSGQGGDIVRSLAFSSDGRTLAVADRTAIRLWDSRTGREWRALRSGTPFSAVGFSSEGTTWGGGSADGALKLLRLDDPSAE